MNLNLLDYKDNAKVKSYLDLILSHSFVPLINKPTRVSKKNATVIDHILTNSYIIKNYITGIVKTDISDHFPVFSIAEKKVSKIQKTDFVIKREINNDNLENFNDALTKVDWSKVFHSSDPNKAYDEFLNIFTSLYDIYFPIKKIKIKSKNLASPWITTGIIKSSKRKQMLYEKWLKRKTTYNNEAYKNYKRLFETIKEKSKKNYFNKHLKNYQKNVKKTWDVIKEVIGNSKPASHTLPKGKR